MYHCENIIENENEIFNSDLIIFFLTNEQLMSKQFLKMLEDNLLPWKTSLFVSIGDLNENFLKDVTLIDAFKMVKFIDPIDSILNKDAFERFEIFLLHSLQEHGLYLPQKIDYTSDTQYLSTSKYVEENTIEEFEIISKDEIILKIRNKGLQILNVNSGETLTKMNNSIIFGKMFCWIAHANQILVSQYKFGEFFAKSGILVKRIDFKTTYILSLAYNSYNKRTYIATKYNVLNFDENFESKRVESVQARLGIKVLNGYIFALNWTKEGSNNEIGDETVEIFNFNFKLLIRIQLNGVKNVFSDPKHLDYVFFDGLNEIQILNTNTFELVGYVKKTQDLHLKMILNEKALLKDNSKNIYYSYKLNLKKSKSCIDNKFICKLNGLNQHLYLNPFLLPCKISACLICIYNHFNIVTSSFKCAFESCKEEHKLQYQLEKDFKLTDEITNNCGDILKSFLEHGKDLMHKKSKLN